MTSQPHLLRCGTCFVIPCRTRSIVDCKFPSGTMNDITSQVGCASHSDSAKSRDSKATPSHARTSDDVLRSDKVLEEEYIEMGLTCPHCDLLDHCPIVDKIELRTKERE